MEREGAVSALGENAVDEQAMKVNIQLEATPEALDHRHGAASPVAHARAAGSAAIEAEHGAHGDAEHRAAERVIEREEVAQAVGQAEHPLAHGDVRENVVHEVGSLLRHAPPATTGAEPASFARERHEALEGTVVAPNACEASADRSTGEELPELALDKAGEPATVGAVGSLA